VRPLADLLHTKTPLLTGSSVSAKREEIRAYFHKTFSLYERLFDVLASDESYAQQPEKLRHPLCFYHGHTAVFFINKLRLAGLLSGRINEGLESTLAIGVDEMSWDDTNSTNYVWPTVGQVRAYRDLCRVVVDDLISSLPLSLPIEWNSPFWIILVSATPPPLRFAVEEGKAAAQSSRGGFALNLSLFPLCMFCIVRWAASTSASIWRRPPSCFANCLSST
jgi:hypothetical protein